MADIEIEIDGKTLTVKPNQTIIQVADEAGIYIPRFCYHKHLSIAANCRMCLVEVEKIPKPQAACSTPVAPGMKVFTRSQKSLDAQRAVMEFLLINHPLDCPICDQGGECELQDLAMGYGSSHSHYDECKRAVADENLGPLIATDMTRCILCTRCVRFGAEIAGIRELGVTFRGEHEEISTFVEQAVTSEVSGNIIDICPVGALTSKPFRFTARAWELDQAPSIAPHDCWGSNLNVHTRYGKVMRVVSRENTDVNETWLSDRDRFSYTSLYHPDRLEHPIAKLDGKWQAIDWQRAFDLAASGLKEVIAKHGADKLGALASPNSTLEEFYLLQKLVRGLGSPHVDHRLREIDTEDQASVGVFPGAQMTIADLQDCDAVLLIGSNLQKEQPLAALRLRKAITKGAVVAVINPVDYAFNFPVKSKHIIAPHLLPQSLESMSGELTNKSADTSETIQTIAALLRDKKKCCIILGAFAQQHPRASVIRHFAHKIAEQLGANVMVMTDGANSAGGWLAGAIPHRHAGGEPINHVGLDAYEMLHKPRKGYLLLNVEPEFDCANPSQAYEALKQAQFVVAISLFRNPVLEEQANVILPMAPFTETSGTYVNVTGNWQSFTGVASAFAASRPAWKILRVLGNYLHLDGFNYESSEEVKHEVKACLDKAAPQQPVAFTCSGESTESTGKATLSRIGEVPIYAVDSLVRRAKPLQDMQEIMQGDCSVVKLHPETAARLQLSVGDIVRVKQHTNEVRLPVVLDPCIAVDAVWLAGGMAATRALGDLMGEVTVEKE